MAKVSMPLMSGEASGSIGPRLVFSKRASGQQVRFQRAQADAATSLQLVQRSKFSTAIGWWSCLNFNEKLAWFELGNSLV